MKNLFVVTSLVLTVGYTSALVAEVIGVLPSGLVSFPVFVACFVASGVLMIAFRDYSGQPNILARSEGQPTARAAAAARVTPAGDLTWTRDTISA